MLLSVQYNPSGNLSWGCIEHLPALHETVHTSEKCWIALVLHVHRLCTPFQQILLVLLALKQNFIATCSLLDSMTIWFYCLTKTKMYLKIALVMLT
jgi:hypothetical protein